MGSRVGTWRGLAGLAAAVVAAIVTTVALQAQSQYFVYLFAADEEGTPVRDLTIDDLRMREGGADGTVVFVERYSWPLKVTVLVDNHLAADSGTGGALVHLRSGLEKFFAELPRDVEVELISTAPNPRWLVKPTADPVTIQKGIGLIVPEEFPARFTDSLVEYASRLELQFGKLGPEDRQPYLPVLVAIGSTGLDGSQIMRDNVLKALTQLRDYRVWTNFFMFNTSTVGSLESASFNANDGATVLIAKAAQEVTGGRYDALALSASNSLNRLLPELAQQIASRHMRQTSQYRVLLERPPSATGPLKDLQLAMMRQGVSYRLSADGSQP